MTSPQFIAFVERKLGEHGVGKIIPKIDLLKQTYRQYAVSHAVKTEFNESRKAIEAKAEKALKVPHDLKQQIEAILKQHSALPWHQAIRFLVDPASILPPKKDDDDNGKAAIGDVVIGDVPKRVRDPRFAALDAAFDDAFDKIQNTKAIISLLNKGADELDRQKQKKDDAP